jgi:hypothetical protein
MGEIISIEVLNSCQMLSEGVIGFIELFHLRGHNHSLRKVLTMMIVLFVSFPTLPSRPVMVIRFHMRRPELIVLILGCLSCMSVRLSR